MIGVLFSSSQEPYRLARVVRFFDPEFKIVEKFDPQGRIKKHLQKSLATRDTNYQLEQSKIAVGAGGLVGVGLMNGRQKLLYLPEAHTDFIYAVVGRGDGPDRIGRAAAGFSMIFWRGLRAALRMRDDFGRYLALGVTVVVVVQGFINMSVVLGMMPTKGIPLPLISYGGSSLLSTLASLGILMNVSGTRGMSMVSLTSCMSCGAGNLARSRLSGGSFGRCASLRTRQAPAESRRQPGLAAPQ